ncbi:putative PHD type zinc finger protein with BAH domain-containing protein [Dispira parvispora]|uniref:PHD type zinc finger protein with BAH domain-containing protein n=1 Tax=Dispira parvispora TaxID=1520584 RepID=A0A9W8ASL2_9FUNG|nr:putative PHD type zinc finger protein with BAH domain-containing protein [Dispira parvispora]
MSHSKNVVNLMCDTYGSVTTTDYIDHVYLAPESNQEAFYIGRVMEFLLLRPDEDQAESQTLGQLSETPGNDTSSSGASTSEQLFAAIAWYQRPGDISDGRSRSQDPRRLVATMHSDINPVSTIRAKCVVTHLDYLPAVLQCYQRAWQRHATFSEALGTGATKIQSASLTGTLPLTGMKRRARRGGATRLDTQGLPRTTEISLQSDLSTLSSDEALAIYTTLPDHFYYSQLFDRYAGRTYDVIPCERVLNVPDHVSQALRERYQYILVEPHKANELTDAHRSCQVCKQWCPPSKSMCCEVCGHNYHMWCLDPPLVTKPGKGYAWQCVSCLRKLIAKEAEEKADRMSVETGPEGSKRLRRRSAGVHKQRHTENSPLTPDGTVTKRKEGNTNGGGSQAATGSENGNAKPLGTPTETIPDTGKAQTPFGITLENLPPPQPTKPTNRWPFRYLGIHSNLDDVIDYDDRIYPRAASRLGSKFQAVIPPLKTNAVGSGSAVSSETVSPRISPTTPFPGSPMDTGSELHLGSGDGSEDHSVSRRRARRNVRNAASVTDDGQGSSAMRTMSDSHRDQWNLEDHLFFRKPKTLADDDLDEYVTRCRELSPPDLRNSMEVMDAILRTLHSHQYHTEAALDYFRTHYRTRVDFGVPVWTPAEQAAFESQVSKTGADMPALHEAVGIRNKTHKQVVRHFYCWKGTKEGRLAYDQYVSTHFKSNWKGIFWAQHDRTAHVTTAAGLTKEGHGAALVSPPRPQGKRGGDALSEPSPDSQPDKLASLNPSRWNGICDPEATAANLLDEGWIVASGQADLTNTQAMDVDETDEWGAGDTPRYGGVRSLSRHPQFTCFNCSSTQAERWRKVPTTLLNSLRVYHNPTHVTGISTDGPALGVALGMLTQTVTSMLTDELQAQHPVYPNNPVMGSRLQPGQEFTPVGQSQQHLSPAVTSPSAMVPPSAGFTSLNVTRRLRSMTHYVCDECGYYWLKYGALPGVGEYERFLMSTSLFSPLAKAQLEPLLDKFHLEVGQLGSQVWDPLAMAPLCLFTSLFVLPSPVPNPLLGGGNASGDGLQPGSRSVSAGGTNGTRVGSRGQSRSSTPGAMVSSLYDSPLGQRHREGAHLADSPLSIRTANVGGGGPKSGKRGAGGKRQFRSDQSSPAPSGPRGILKRAKQLKAFPPTPCMVCGHPDTNNPALYTCEECGVSVHAYCYGLTPTNDTSGGFTGVNKKNWCCDACRNVKQPYISKQYMCMLCRQPGRGTLHGLVGCFEALKPTINNNWVHMWCALGVSELTFGNEHSLQPVDGIQSLTYNQWTHTCEICRLRRLPAGASGNDNKQHVTPISEITSTPGKDSSVGHSGESMVSPSQLVQKAGHTLRPKRTLSSQPSPTAVVHGSGPVSRLIESIDECSVCVPCRVPSCRRYVHVSCAIRACWGKSSAMSGEGDATKWKGTTSVPHEPCYRVGFEAMTQHRPTRPTTVATFPTPFPITTAGSSPTTASTKRGKGIEDKQDYPVPTGTSTVDIADISAFFAHQGQLAPVVYCPAHNKERIKNFVALSAVDKQQNPILPAYVNHTRISRLAGKGALLKSQLVAQQLTRFPPYNSMSLLAFAAQETEAAEAHATQGGAGDHRPPGKVGKNAGLPDVDLVPPSLAMAMLAQDHTLGPVPQKKGTKLPTNDYLWPIASIPSPLSPDLTPVDGVCARCDSHHSPVWWSNADLDLFNTLVSQYGVIQGGISTTVSTTDPHSTFPDQSTSSGVSAQDLQNALASVPAQATANQEEVLTKLIDTFIRLKTFATEHGQGSTQTTTATSPTLPPPTQKQGRHSLADLLNSPIIEAPPPSQTLCHRCFLQRLNL